MEIVNSRDEQLVNIKFCVHLRKLGMETIKLLREACGCVCMAELTTHKWHSTFSTNLNEALLREKKGGEPPMLIMETSINTVRAVVNDHWHLSTKALEALLHIPQMMIHLYLTEKQEMAHVASVWVLHTLTSDQMWIYVQGASKFLRLIAEDSTYQNQVMTCDETWAHHYDRSLSRKVSIGRGKMNHRRNRFGSRSWWVRTR